MLLFAKHIEHEVLFSFGTVADARWLRPSWRLPLISTTMLCSCVVVCVVHIVLHVLLATHDAKIITRRDKHMRLGRHTVLVVQQHYHWHVTMFCVSIAGSLFDFKRAPGLAAITAHSLKHWVPLEQAMALCALQIHSMCHITTAIRNQQVRTRARRKFFCESWRRSGCLSIKRCFETNRMTSCNWIT